MTKNGRLIKDVWVKRLVDSLSGGLRGGEVCPTSYGINQK